MHTNIFFMSIEIYETSDTNNDPSLPEMWQDHHHRWVATVTLLITITLATINSSLATDPTLDPETVSDQYGNSADANSAITWGDLVEGNYTGNKKYDDGQMEVFIKMKDNFVDLLQPDMLDTGL